MTDRTQDVVRTLQIKFEGLTVRPETPEDMTRGADISAGPVITVRHDAKDGVDVAIHAADRQDVRRLGQDIFYHLSGLTLGQNRRLHLTFTSVKHHRSVDNTRFCERQRFFAAELTEQVPVPF